MSLSETATTLVVDFSIHPILPPGALLAIIPWDSKETWATTMARFMEMTQ